MSNRPPRKHDEGAAPVDALTGLLARNQAWVKRKTANDSDFFQRLLGQQRPDYLWIGCSDSRVPATEIVDLDPGEMFVHRNVANLTPADDANFSAVLHYAVDQLGVRHIMVVGHYGCGGIWAAHNGLGDDIIGEWLSPLQALEHRHHAALEELDEAACLDRLCELNVIAQVEQLCANPLIRQAWEAGRDLTIHGLVYGIGDGLLAPVCASVSHPPAGHIAPIRDDAMAEPQLP
jgi:carbonic anhydrase